MEIKDNKTMCLFPINMVEQSVLLQQSCELLEKKSTIFSEETQSSTQRLPQLVLVFHEDRHPGS